jgi:hypothetical protein
LNKGIPSAMSLSLKAGSPATPLIDQVKWAAWSQLTGQADWLSWRWSQRNVNHTRSFDTWGRLTRYPLGPWLRSLQYDEADRISTYTHTASDGSTPVSVLNQSFGYDKADRLISSQSGIRQWRYSHDLVGNRSSASNPVGNTSSTSTQTYTPSPTSNRLQSLSPPATTWVYDARGNTQSVAPWTLTHDSAGQLSSLTVTQAGQAGQTHSYQYDTDRRRVLKSGPHTDPNRPAGNASAYVYGPSGELLGEYALPSGAPIREYVWLGSTPVAVVTQAPGASSAEIFEIHADHLNAPRVALDTQGRQRWTWLAEPFGNEAANPAPTQNLGAVNIPLR